MVRDIVDYIKKENQITKEQLKILLELSGKSDIKYIMKEASQTAKISFGNNIYIRGLIEFTNYCRNDCYYCGIRNSNSNAKRYRLTDEQILNCCDIGYELGFRTFVLQGGEDTFFTDYKVCSLVSSIKNKYPDCAVTLSIGEKLKRVIRLILMQALTDTFLGMKQQMKSITECFTQNICLWKTERDVFMI